MGAEKERSFCVEVMCSNDGCVELRRTPLFLINLFFQKNDVFCLQSQLAHLHEKHGEEALRAEQLETLNNDSKMNLEHIISENAALSETIERLEYENRRLTEKFNLQKNDLKDKSESELLHKPAHVRALAFHFNLPSLGCSTSKSAENIKIFPDFTAYIEVLVGRKGDKFPISLTLKINKMVTCSTTTVTFYNKMQGTPVFTYKT